jgi:hypothetical protein
MRKANVIISPKANIPRGKQLVFEGVLSSSQALKFTKSAKSLQIQKA